MFIYLSHASGLSGCLIRCSRDSLFTPSTHTTAVRLAFCGDLSGARPHPPLEQAQLPFVAFCGVKHSLTILIIPIILKAQEASLIILTIRAVEFHIRVVEFLGSHFSILN